MKETPSLEKVVRDLKKKTFPFVIIPKKAHPDARKFWEEIMGEKNVIMIDSTYELPAVISAVIGVTEGVIEVTDIEPYLKDKVKSPETIRCVSRIKAGAQAQLRHKLPHPVPQKGDLFASKEDLWPIQPGGTSKVVAKDESEDSELL